MSEVSLPHPATHTDPLCDPTPAPHGGNGFHRATYVLRTVLGNQGLPAGDAAVYEGLAGLSRAAQAISGWIPDSQIWRDLTSHLREQTSLREDFKGAYSSGIAPGRLNPLYGDFRTFPLYAGLVAGEQIPHSPAWTFIAGLACWPSLQATLRGYEPPEPPEFIVRSVYPLLRETATSVAALDWLTALLKGVDGPASLIEAIKRLPVKEQKSARTRGLSELAHQFVIGQETAAIPPAEEEDDLPSSAFGTVLANPDEDDTSGLAPDDHGAAQSVLEVDATTDDALVHTRTIGAAKDFNHVHLRWDALTSEEIEYFANAYPTLIPHEATRSGAIGLAISASAGFPLQNLAQIRLAASVEEGKQIALAEKIAIAPMHGRLVAISLVPVPVNAIRQKGQNEQYLPISPVILTALPASCAVALNGSGWQPGESLARRFPTLAADARSALAGMRQESGLRLTPGRLHGAIAKEIYTLTQDECVASLIHPLARIPVGAGRYYLSLTCQEVSDIHFRATQKLFPDDLVQLDLPDPLKSSYVGSQLVVETSLVASALSALRERLAAKVKTGRRNVSIVAEAINAHSIWLAVLTRMLVFVRPVVAPLPRPCDLDANQGFALVCDKRESIRNEQRLVPLADVIVEQMRLARETLEAAALFFDRHAPELAAQVRSLLLEGRGCASIPALPYLDQHGGQLQFRELRPDDVAWPEFEWPANVGRHLGITRAHHMGLSRELVSVIFGHAEVGQTPYGWDSTLTPQLVQEMSRAFLNDLAASLRLTALPALNTYSLDEDEQDPQYLPIPVYGDDRPGRNLRRHLTLVEKQLLRNAGIRLTTIDSYSLLDAEAEISRILEAGPHRSAQEKNWLQKLANRYLRLKLRSRESIPSNAVLKIPLEAESGSVERAELLLFNRGKQVREETLCMTDAFLQSSPEKANAHEWMALIALNAVVFGGCLQPNAAEGIANGCITGMRTFKGAVLLDWETDRGEFRFCADAQTGALITRWLEFRDSDPGELDIKAFRTQFRTLLSKLAPLNDAPYAWPGCKTRQSRLRMAIGAFMRRYVPGVLLAHMQGARRSTPVPIACLQRELGLRPPLPNLENDTANWRPAQIGANASDAAEKAITALRKSIAKIRPTSASGGVSKGTRGERLTGLEADIAELEKSLGVLAQESGNSVVAHIVIARVRQLVRKGGRLKRLLATSTIAEYMAPVLRFAESSIGRSMLSADPSDLANTYRTIILSGAPSKANLRYRSLADFHQLAVEEFGVEDIDWTEIAGEIPGVTVRVDANLIFPHEVDLALSLLADAPNVPKDIRLRAMLAISLMADLGLRFGEIYRLLHKHLSPERRFLYIRNTRDGEVKTHNGIRVVPFDVLATNRTKSLLDRVLMLTDPEGKLGGKAALFGSLGNPKELMSRSLVARLANQAIRAATGDPSTRLHHLRHSVATILFDKIVLPADRQASAPLLREIVGTVEPTRRALWSLATLLGHGSGRTTMLSYLHHQERRVAQAMDRMPLPVSDKHLATLIGQSESAIRTYRSRGKDRVALLLGYARKVLVRFPAMDITHGVSWAAPPEVLDTDWVAKEANGGLAQANYLLRLQFLSRLTPIAAAHIAGATEFYASRLADCAKDIAKELLLPSEKDGTPKCFLTPRCALGRSQTLIDSISSIPISENATKLAMLSLRTYDHGRYAWTCRDGYGLKNVIAWLSLAGIPLHEICLRVPASRWVEIEHLVGKNTFVIAQILPIDGRSQRTRGTDSVEVTIKTSGEELPGAKFVHATYLKLIHWRVIS